MVSWMHECILDVRCAELHVGEQNCLESVEK